MQKLTLSAILRSLLLAASKAVIDSKVVPWWEGLLALCPKKALLLPSLHLARRLKLLREERGQ
jgi:hypothetical protein